MAKFLEFMLENQDYAISVNSVCNISQPNKIFRVPHTPDFVLGVTHYRGYILTVIDLKCRGVVYGRIIKLDGIY